MGERAADTARNRRTYALFENGIPRAYWYSCNKEY